jgi:hypothetical protein
MHSITIKNAQDQEVRIFITHISHIIKDESGVGAIVLDSNIKFDLKSPEFGYAIRDLDKIIDIYRLDSGGWVR